MRLWVIRVGWFDARADAFVPDDESGVRAAAPVYSCLTETDEGRLLLFDTGCSRELARDPRSILGDEVTVLQPRLLPADYIADRLEELGFHAGDVAQVAISHLHFDHAGGNAAFPNAEFWIQRVEWEAAHASDAAHHYPDPAWHPRSGRVRLLDGDTEWAPGLKLIATPGHTPGHQSLLVDLATTRLLYTSDAVYRSGLFDPDHIGAAVDPAASRRSVVRLKRLTAEGYRPIFSHDPDQWREDWLTLAPAYFT